MSSNLSFLHVSLIVTIGFFNSVFSNVLTISLLCQLTKVALKMVNEFTKSVWENNYYQW